MSYLNENGELKVLKTVTSIIFAALIIGLVLGSVFVVKTGHKAVVYTLGSAKMAVGEGVHFKLPLVQSIEKVDVRTQKEEAEANAASKDSQNVTANVAVNYNLQSTDLLNLVRNVGISYEEKILKPAIQETVKSVTAQFTADELITKREEVRQMIKSNLSEKLSPIGVSVYDISITNFQFSPSYNEAIERKVTAEQNALRAKNELEQTKYEAEKTITEAKAQAESIRIQAQAINSQGGADYVELKKIEKWDGKGCTQYCGLETSTGLLITN